MPQDVWTKERERQYEEAKDLERQGPFQDEQGRAPAGRRSALRPLGELLTRITAGPGPARPAETLTDRTTGMEHPGETLRSHPRLLFVSRHAARLRGSA